MSLDTETRSAIKRYVRQSREVRLLFAADPTIAATAVDALAVTLRESLYEAVIQESAKEGGGSDDREPERRVPERGLSPAVLPGQSDPAGPTPPHWDPERPYGCPFCLGSFTDFGLRAHDCPTKTTDPDAERAHLDGA